MQTDNPQTEPPTTAEHVAFWTHWADAVKAIQQANAAVNRLHVSMTRLSGPAPLLGICDQDEQSLGLACGAISWQLDHAVSVLASGAPIPVDYLLGEFNSRKQDDAAHVFGYRLLRKKAAAMLRVAEADEPIGSPASACQPDAVVVAEAVA